MEPHLEEPKSLRFATWTNAEIRSGIAQGLWMILMGYVAVAFSLAVELTVRPRGPSSAIHGLSDRWWQAWRDLPPLLTGLPVVAMVLLGVLVVLPTSILAGRILSERKYLILAIFGGALPGLALGYASQGSGLVLLTPLWVLLIIAGTMRSSPRPVARLGEFLLAAVLPAASLVVWN